MARPLRIQFPGAVYHVISRGNARAAVFLDDADRRDFLTRLWQIVDRLGWQVWAYCLMDNHYHLLLHTRHPNLSAGMRDLNGGYSLQFNKSHDRVGHVFQGRYKALLVDEHGYLLEVARYVMLNPVEAGQCRAAEDWTWSSYRATLGLAAPPPGLAAERLLQVFGTSVSEARRLLAAFVEAGLAAPNPTAARRVPTVVGSDAFVQTVSERATRVSTEVPRLERAWKPLSEYAREAPSRNDAMRRAYASGGYSQAAIAKYFGLDYATVSRLLRNRG